MESEFQRLYSFLFDVVEHGGDSVTEDDRPVPSVIFVVNFDKVQFTDLHHSSRYHAFRVKFYLFSSISGFFLLDANA